MTGEGTPGTEGGWRIMRGAVVGLTATALAVGGHGVAGGQAPGWATTCCLAVLLGAVATRLSSLRWTFPRLLVLLLGAQALLHAAMVGSMVGSTAGSRTPVAHLHHGAEQATAMPQGNLAMVAGHLTAAVLTALLLRRGETWLSGVLEALALRVFRLLDVVVTAYGEPSLPVPVHVHDVPSQHAGADAWRQRGPPFGE